MTPSSKDKTNKLNRLFEKEEWFASTKLIRELLARKPNSHWLLTRMSAAYYQQRQYKRALQYSKKATSLFPDCPLALWDLASILEMLEREKEAITIWKSLLKRGVKNIAYGECGEGKRWAQSLLNDCRFSIAETYLSMGRKKLSSLYINEHLTHRAPGLFSLFSMKEAKKLQKTIEEA